MRLRIGSTKRLASTIPIQSAASSSTRARPRYMMVNVIWKTSRLDAYWRYSVTLSSVSRMNSSTSGFTGRATNREDVVVAAELDDGADELGVARRDQCRHAFNDMRDEGRPAAAVIPLGVDLRPHQIVAAAADERGVGQRSRDGERGEDALKLQRVGIVGLARLFRVRPPQMMSSRSTCACSSM